MPPKVSTKKPAPPKARKPRVAAARPAPIEDPAIMESAPMTAVEDLQDQTCQPPTTPIETSGLEKSEIQAAGDKDRIATSLNIAKLQAMAMTDLNQMAKELGIENFGTMRKHEVIFHILQKNAERAGVLFSEGVLEVLPEGFGFLRSQSFNYLPCPEDITFLPRRFAASICRPAT